MISALEGIEGTGKSTQTPKLALHFREQGEETIESREPGTALVPMTLSLRKLMLDAYYVNDRRSLRAEIRIIMNGCVATVLPPIAAKLLRWILTQPSLDKIDWDPTHPMEWLTNPKGTIPPPSEDDATTHDPMGKVDTELISQAIRSLHIEYVLRPAKTNGTTKHVVLDRSLFSGLAYGYSCGHDPAWLEHLAQLVLGVPKVEDIYNFYDRILYLSRDDDEMDSLVRAQRVTAEVKEFQGGDKMENRGLAGQMAAKAGFEYFMPKFGSRIILVSAKGTIEEVHQRIVGAIGGIYKFHHIPKPKHEI